MTEPDLKAFFPPNIEQAAQDQAVRDLCGVLGQYYRELVEVGMPEPLAQLMARDYAQLVFSLAHAAKLMGRRIDSV